MTLSVNGRPLWNALSMRPAGVKAVTSSKASFDVIPHRVALT